MDFSQGGKDNDWGEKALQSGFSLRGIYHPGMAASGLKNKVVGVLADKPKSVLTILAGIHLVPFFFNWNSREVQSLISSSTSKILMAVSLIT